MEAGQHRLVVTSDRIQKGVKDCADVDQIPLQTLKDPLPARRRRLIGILRHEAGPRSGTNHTSVTTRGGSSRRTSTRSRSCTGAAEEAWQGANRHEHVRLLDSGPDCRQAGLL
jgi:hypothetical protein